jgi:hypothetical protein
MTNKLIEELKANKKPLHPKCTDHPTKPCSKTHASNGLEGDFCIVYFDPSAMWRLGDCPMADEHLRTKSESKKEKVRMGQQKQKKGK